MVSVEQLMYSTKKNIQFQNAAIGGEWKQNWNKKESPIY